MKRWGILGAVVVGLILVIGGVALASGHLPYERHHHIQLWW